MPFKYNNTLFTNSKEYDALSSALLYGTGIVKTDYVPPSTNKEEKKAMKYTVVWVFHEGGSLDWSVHPADLKYVQKKSTEAVKRGFIKSFVTKLEE